MRVGAAWYQVADGDLAQNALLDMPEPLAGFGAEFFDKLASDLLIDAEGFSRSPAAIQGQHEMLGYRLIPGVLTGQQGQGAHEVGEVPASECDACSDHGRGEIPKDERIADLLRPQPGEPGEWLALPHLVGFVEVTKSPLVVAAVDE
ncbi:hypothetical protein SAZ11_44755 [Streptomyces sp. FXJ1.4098]|nr:hypothetical protein [Streptomyces sp. FXJ1.4098]